MRHQVFGRKLGRDTKSRKALLNNLASSLMEQDKVITTLAKAKFAKPFVDKLITKAKKNALYSKRIIASLLTPKAFTKLINEIVPGFTTRTGGYTRIIKLAQRRGDSAPMARLELLEITENSEKKKRVSATSVIKNQHKSDTNPPKSKS